MRVNYIKKNRAFSLIEVVVAVAIIGILSSFVLPQVRNQIAKSKDTKAITTLDTFRVAIQMYQIDKAENLIDTANNSPSDTDIKNALEKLLPYLDSRAKKIVDNSGIIEIGGSREGKENSGSLTLEKVIYGGKVQLSFVNPENNKVDSLNLWLKPIGNTKTYDTKGNKWIEY